MIYLTKSFTCVIVSRWRTYINIYSFLNILGSESFEFALKAHPNHHNIIIKLSLHVLFVNLKYYVMGMTKCCQQ